MSVDGELAQVTDDPADDLSPNWSPDGSKLAFSSNRAGRQQIYVINADGTSLSQITNSAGDDTDPVWSLDGNRIAFTSSRDGNKEIYLMNVDGSNETRLTTESGVDSSPKWSPDGRILFTSNRDGHADLYVMDAAGHTVTRLTTMGAGQAAWSPDGGRITFVSTSTEKIDGHFPFQVFVADATGSNVRILTSSPDSAHGPCWLPDGKAIAFHVDKLGVMANIFQIELDGGKIRRLTAGPKIDARPAFSPDGSKLAFQSNRDGDYEIYVMNLH